MRAWLIEDDYTGFKFYHSVEPLDYEDGIPPSEGWQVEGGSDPAPTVTHNDKWFECPESVVPSVVTLKPVVFSFSEKVVF